MQRRSLRVLIIDEDRSHREMLKAALLPLGAQLDMAEIDPGGTILVGKSYRPSPSLILVNVPDSSLYGASALAAIRLLHPGTPMIVMATDPAVLQIAMTPDFRLPSYISPDVQPDRLRGLILSILGSGEIGAADEGESPGEAIEPEAEPAIPLASLVRLQSLFPGYEVHVSHERA